MKANRKFIEDENANGFFWGAILMIGFTVVIAAIVYHYVSSFESKEPVVLCGHIKYIPVENEWGQHGVLQMDDNHFYSIGSIEDSDYALLKFAFQRNCSVSLVLVYTIGNDIFVKGDSVVLMDCGCEGGVDNL